MRTISKRTEIELEEIESDLTRLRVEGEQTRGPLFDVEAVRAAILTLIAHPDFLDWPPEKLRPLLQQALPAVYVAGGKIVGGSGGETGEHLSKWWDESRIDPEAEI